MPNVIGTSTGASALRSMCRNMMRGRLAPIARAAVTNSICLSFRNSARVSRAMPVQLVTPMIAIRW